MNVLGIETSCDETAAAVVKDGKYILSNIVSSSLKLHQKYGGIIPEIASRQQLELIQIVVNNALHQAGITLNGIDAIAVTGNPGLIGSLLVGMSYARALSYATKKPLAEINHIQAHLYASFLSSKNGKAPDAQSRNQTPKLPAIGLVVSGGHSSIFHIKSFRKYIPLGQTRDDAAGETFDKVARILDLGYPGGPAIDRLAKKEKNSHIRFTCAELPGTYDFSFSGIKTAVLYYVRKHPDEKRLFLNQIAHAFQKSVVAVLVDKCIRACKETKIRNLVVGGGVAANSGLRQSLCAEAERNDIEVFFPPISLCIDNAAMVAGLGYQILYERRKQ
ncbi:MAG TPA: tRNA (adenosine(37)-N6)-threonylcarbamoyltransferase complex transferase subunit TsaD [Candidatus Omnitrophota bacterium]|nr:tRNA (adenosine(37)-N6)-threonylcarbamoyltransferase complex transferase subunit TsaD [Candidatus Omnitrophota bacterium]HPD85277.1 tRNA (adenosine(37)-N6)-threonylcarbamoyltransferase complex transferase subunit TsaD [Candidatus Omnitrophota bacterium]HRZ04222.1 tRNA (adenosine(37)-N6)-threonylcarbamoyltransferase complex transferase subunit TsaD [Candidatus Omnitrophota bacterium]